MPKQCAVCNKKVTFTEQRKKLMSKYNPTPKKKKNPNLQSVFVPKETSVLFKKFSGQRIRACTKCLKSLTRS